MYANSKNDYWAPAYDTAGRVLHLHFRTNCIYSETYGNYDSFRVQPTGQLDISAYQAAPSVAEIDAFNANMRHVTTLYVQAHPESLNSRATGSSG